MKILVLLFSLICASCAAGTAATGTKPSQVNKNATALDGQIITIQGWLIIENEEAAIWDDPKDRDDNAKPNRCISLLVPKSMRTAMIPFSRKTVALTGRFIKDVATLKPLVFFALCNTTAIEVAPDKLPEIVTKQ